MGMIEAQVIDENHLKLLYPVQIPPFSKIMISIISKKADESEDEGWFRLSRQGLEAAYGDDEPEYSEELVIKPNPDFQP